jgi:hypothetical protein
MDYDKIWYDLYAVGASSKIEPLEMHTIGLVALVAGSIQQILGPIRPTVIYNCEVITYLLVR